MRTPSASIVISTLALAVAVTGTASATGLINGRSIKNHTITANKLATGAVTTRSLAPGVRLSGPTGPVGPAGATVIVPAAAGTLISVDGPSVTVPAGGYGTSSASCPAGSRFVSGGFSDMSLFSTGAGMASESPAVKVVPEGASYNGERWVVNARNIGTADQTQPWHAVVYCA